MRGITWRICIALLVFLLSLAFALPSLPLPEQAKRFLPDSAIRLGLDLKGGISLTLGVDVDEALAASLSMTGQRLLREARDEGVPAFRRHGADRSSFAFRLAKASGRHKLETLCSSHFPGLVLHFGEADADGGLPVWASYTESEAKRLKDDAASQALATIRNRIDAFGVSEPDIRKQAGWRILVQLPGISDPRRAVELIGRTAKLEFCMVREDCDPESPVPPQGVRILSLQGRDGENEGRIAVDRDAAMSGEDVADARPGFDELNVPCVQLSFSGKGAEAFERLSAENVGRRMAIVLDNVVMSAPVIRERIAGGRCSITGGFTTAEAQDLSIALRSGSLAAPVSVLEERTVGPTLGRDSIRQGLAAGAMGALLVMGFMCCYYGAAGAVACAMLAFNLLIMAAGMGGFGGVLTLPGIAGIVLTIGMAVDANVLIYERIREEQKFGRTASQAIRLGFDRAATAIADSNITTLVTAGILYQFGTGPVRGFAVTLSLGILASMFTAVFVSRTIFEVWIRRIGSRRIGI